MRVVARLAAGASSAALALVAGAVVGACAAVLSSLWWGALVGVLASAGAVAALPAGWRSRVPFALGWAVVVLRLALRRPEGDYVVAADAGGYALLGLGVALVVASVVSVPAPAPRPESPPRRIGEDRGAPTRLRST